MKNIKFDIKIDGMHCKSCEILISDAIKELDGIKNIKVDYKLGIAKIEFDDSKTTGLDIINKIKREGYRVRK